MSFNRSYSYEANVSRSPFRKSVHSGHSSFFDTQSNFKRPLPTFNHLPHAEHYSSLQSLGGRPHLHHSHSLEEPRSLTSQKFKFLTSSSPVSSTSATHHTSVGTFNPISQIRSATRDPFSAFHHLSTGSSSFVGRRLSSAGLSPRPLNSTRRLSILWVTNQTEI